MNGPIEGRSGLRKTIQGIASTITDRCRHVDEGWEGRDQANAGLPIVVFQALFRGPV
jgi:hypothetical protein